MVEKMREKTMRLCVCVCVGGGNGSVFSYAMFLLTATIPKDARFYVGVYSIKMLCLFMIECGKSLASTGCDEFT